MTRIDKGESQSVKVLIKVLVLKFVKFVLNIKKIEIQALSLIQNFKTLQEI